MKYQRKKRGKVFLSVKRKPHKVIAQSGGIFTALDSREWSANSSAWGQGYIVCGKKKFLPKWTWPSVWGRGWVSGEKKQNKTHKCARAEEKDAQHLLLKLWAGHCCLHSRHFPGSLEPLENHSFISNGPPMDALGRKLHEASRAYKKNRTTCSRSEMSAEKNQGNVGWKRVPSCQSEKRKDIAGVGRTLRCQIVLKRL